MQKLQIDLREIDRVKKKGIITILTRVEAQRGPLQDSRVLANIPDVEVYKDGYGGERCHSEPGQHEDVSQHDELKNKHRKTSC